MMFRANNGNILWKSCKLCFTKICNSLPKQFSSSGSSVPFKVTLDNIFSAQNKERVQKSLLSVLPVRNDSHVFNKHADNSQDKYNRAVLIPLCYINNEPSILYTLRSTSLRQHRGEVSFPGGKKDDTDSDLIHTALRETQEELGLDSGNIDVWGSLWSMPDSTGRKYYVTPVLGFCGDVDLTNLNTNKDEVELVFTRTIKSMIDKENIRSTQWQQGYTLPVYLGGPARIWGMTAIATHQALTLIAPKLYNYKIRHNS